MATGNLDRLRESRRSRNRFLLAGILGSVLSSIAWVTEQESINRLSPITVAALAPLTAGLLMGPYTLRFKRRPTTAQILKMWKPFLAVMLIRNIFGVLVFTTALTMTSSAKVMFLTKIEPYVVLFLHWTLYNERVPSKDLLLLLVHVVGAIILSTGGEFHIQLEQAGDILVLLGILGNALMYRPGKALSEEWGSGFVSTVGSSLAGAILLPFALWFHPEDFTSTQPHLVGYSYMLITVVIFYIISTTLWYYSLKGIEPWLNSALRCVGPIVAAPIAWICFDKGLTSAQLVGAAIVILTSALLVRGAGARADSEMLDPVIPEAEPD